MNRHSARFCVRVIALLMFLSSASAGQSVGEITDVQLGIGGHFKTGHWTPLRVSLLVTQASHGHLQVRVRDGDGALSSYQFGVRSLAAGQRHDQWCYIKLGRDETPIGIAFVRDDGSTLRRTLASGKESDQQKFVVSLGADLGVGEALPRGVEHREILDAGQVPDHRLGYDGVDLVVISASATRFLAQLSPSQKHALADWTQFGGNIVIVASTRSADWPLGQHPFSELLPGTIEGVVSQRQTTGIEQFAEAVTPVQAGASAAAFEIPMANLIGVDGSVPVVEGFGSGRPAIVRGSIGLGQCVFVAFDLNSKPFDTWPDRSRAVARVMDLALNYGQVDERRTEVENKTASSLGFNDLSGQLRHALDQFPGVGLIPFSVTATLIAIYIILIGPLDYWLLRRWGGPMLTWLTFLLLVVGFFGAAVAICATWKANELTSHQVTVVDIDPDMGLARGSTWAHLYAPKTAKLDLDIQVNPFTRESVEPQRVLSWQGLPGSAFGGMNSGLAVDAFSRPYLIQMNCSKGSDAHVFLDEFPIATRSSRALFGQWWSRSLRIDSTASQLTEVSESMLTGHVKNPLAIELQDARLLYDDWVYDLGTLAAQGTASLNGRDVIKLRTLLNQRRIVDGRATIDRWDAQNADLDRIMLMMMFYSSGRARTYTQLNHDYQSFIDFSRHLTSGRAVLLGRCRDPATEITRDGQPLPTDAQIDSTFFRVLLRVRTEK